MAFGDHAFGDAPFGATPKASIFLSGSGTLRFGSDFAIYVATAEFITQASDTPAQQPFAGTLDQPLHFSASILGGSLIGQYTAGQGELILTNADATYDFLLQQYAIDGRAITVRLGVLGQPYASAPIIFRGTASDWSVDESTLQIQIEDQSYKLLIPFQTNLYAGSGGSEGGADLAKKRKPRVLGPNLNVQPPLIDPAFRTYQVNDGPVSDIPAVYDRGSALTKDADYATYAALVAATIPAGSYATCFAQAFFRLQSAAVGTVTADVNGDKTGGTYVTATGDIVRRIITLASVMNDPADLYLPSFTALALSQPAPVGYWADENDTSTVADVLGRLMGGIGGWAGFRRSGKLDVQVFTLPAGIPLARWSKNNGDVINISRDKLPSGLSPPPWRQRVAYQRIGVTQNDLAGSISDARKAFLAQPFRVAEASSATVKADHPFANDTNVVDAYFANQSDAQTEATRRLTMYRSTRSIYRLTVPVSSGPMDRDIGDTILVTFPRFDLTTGRLLRIVAMTDNAQADTVEVVGYG